MIRNRFSLLTLIGLVLLLGYLNYLILRPFLIPIIWAVVLAILFYPLHTFVLKHIRYRSMASLLTLAVILVLIVGPFSYLSFLLANEVAALQKYAEGGRFDVIRSAVQHPAVRDAGEAMTSVAGITPGELDRIIADNIAQLGKELVGKITKGVREVLSVLLDFSIMALATFFFLRDGPAILRKFYHYAPFSARQKERLARQVRDVVVSTVYGGVAVAMAQGLMGGVAFYFVGIASPILWGVAMAFASFLPLIGPFIVWVPATIYLLFEGEVLRGAALALIGAFGISTIDNVLRPLIVGTRAKMHFLAIFVSVLGGIKIFGLLGFVLGPLVLAVFVSVVEIFMRVEEKGQAT